MMYRPPLTPPYRPTPTEPTWRSILASYAVVAAIPPLLWLANQPLVGVVALAGTVGVVLGLRRARRLARCLVVCRGVAVDVIGTVRVTVTRLPADDPC